MSRQPLSPGTPPPKNLNDWQYSPDTMTFVNKLDSSIRITKFTLEEYVTAEQWPDDAHGMNVMLNRVYDKMKEAKHA